MVTIKDSNNFFIIFVIINAKASMVITINKDTNSEEIDKALKKLQKSKKKNLSNFYGKLKGAFGDGMEYQKKIRDEWN
ncbi:MAG: hypothetical protein JWQ63_720 [Mucilaginibacter sp.]|nr:hypothetical protein [Mucilaginibacter sp.]